MNEAMSCYNLHGHEYLTYLTFSFENLEEIGYAIDFKEIKRVFVQYLQDTMDHGMILNPKDSVVIKAVQDIGTKLWLMSLNGKEQYCNPSVENIAKEIFLSMEIISNTLYGGSNTGLEINKVIVYETENCWTECTNDSISSTERVNFYENKFEEIRQYALNKGVMEYDDRKFNS